MSRIHDWYWRALTDRQLYVLRHGAYEAMRRHYDPRLGRKGNMARWVCLINEREVDVTAQVISLHRRKLAWVWRRRGAMSRTFLPRISPRGG